MADLFILSIIVLWAVVVVKKLLKDKKSGRCTGCTSSSCSSCSKCNSAYFDELIKKAKENANG